MKTKTIVSLMFLGLILSACGPTPSESSQATTSELTTSLPTTSEAVSSAPSEPVSVPSVSTNEDPIVSPTIEFNVAPAYTGTFWNGLNTTLVGQELRDHLNTYMWARFTKIDYNTVSDAIKEMDQDPNNPSNILSLYDLHSLPKNKQNLQWNREHTFPQSKLADGNDALRAKPTVKNISSDAANLFAADNDLNEVRSNYSFINLDLEAKYEQYTVYNGFGTRTDNFIYRGYFAPTQKVRGEIARAQLYMLIMYPENCSISENFALGDMLTWNLLHPATVERDIQRNAGLEKYQTLRNPFIDRPELACQIFSDVNPSTRNACGV